ncbi:hypothetical protein J6590_058491 [Homalodisca vitripennis]|nr:hypothetical protein J6590_058491 [Homalodisca vitripennis]
MAAAGISSRETLAVAIKDKKLLLVANLEEGVSLSDLKSTELKRELEERDLETSGTKSVLQNRLRQALVADGIDPDECLYESSDVDTWDQKLEYGFTTLETNLNGKRGSDA